MFVNVSRSEVVRGIVLRTKDVLPFGREAEPATEIGVVPVASDTVLRTASMQNCSSRPKLNPTGADWIVAFKGSNGGGSPMPASDLGGHHDLSSGCSSVM